MSNEDNDRLRRIIKSEEDTRGERTPAPIDPTSGNTTPLYRPSLDKDNMPLPRRVTEVDVEGTRVSRAAYEPTSQRIPQQQSQGTQQTQGTSQQAPQTTQTPRQKTSQFNFSPINWRGGWGCFLRGLIASAFVVVETLPSALAKLYPRQIPVTRLGRLATRSDLQGQGLGRLLLADAVNRARGAAQAVGNAGILVDAKDDGAASFYRHFGFHPCRDAPLQLYLPIC